VCVCACVHDCSVLQYTLTIDRNLAYRNLFYKNNCLFYHNVHIQIYAQIDLHIQVCVWSSKHQVSLARFGHV